MGAASIIELWVLCALTVVLAAAFALITVDVWRTNAPVAMDRALARMGAGAGQDNLLAGHARLTAVAESFGTRGRIGLGAALLVLVAIVWRDYVAAPVPLLAPVVTFGIIEYIAKPAINQRIAYGGRSYPSGHAAGVAALATIAIILVYRRWGGLAAGLISPLAIAPVVLVGLAVLRLDFHHYASDVVGGAALGASVALAVTFLLALLGRLVRPRRTAKGQLLAATSGGVGATMPAASSAATNATASRETRS